MAQQTIDVRFDRRAFQALAEKLGSRDVLHALGLRMGQDATGTAIRRAVNTIQVAKQRALIDDARARGREDRSPPLRLVDPMLRGGEG